MNCLSEFIEFLKECWVLLVIMTAIAIVPTAIAWHAAWHRADLQTEAYHRQGIQISREEVFWGVIPPELVVQVKQPPARQP